MYDFARWFDIKNAEPKNKRNNQIREYYKVNENSFRVEQLPPYLINHYHNNPVTKPEEYFYALLLLFKDWRNTDELKDGEDSHEKSFQKQESMEDNDEVDDFVPIGVANDMNDFRACADKAVENECNIEDLISKVNEDQLRIFNKITNQIMSENKIVRFFINGHGGTGKSFLIKTIVQWTKSTLNKQTAAAAPTGIAAYNIDGLTLHRLLQLPLEKGLKKSVYTELSSSALEKFRETFKEINVIIIDEISMVSNVMLGFILLRLQQIFNTSETKDGWFGKKHIIFFGDLFQLPPIDDPFAFVDINTKTVSTRFRSISISINLWSLFEYDELTINMRQKNDLAYYELLSRIRLGLVTKSDIDTLETR